MIHEIHTIQLLQLRIIRSNDTEAALYPLFNTQVMH
jgi:hypothetical protein